MKPMQVTERTLMMLHAPTMIDHMHVYKECLLKVMGIGACVLYNCLY